MHPNQQRSRVARKHVVVVRLMEFLEQVQDDDGTGGTFLSTVCESFAMTQPRVQALHALVSSQVAEVGVVWRTL